MNLVAGVADLNLKLLTLDLLKGFATEYCWVANSLLQLGFCEIEAAGCLAEIKRVEPEEFWLVESVGEEGVDRVILRELFFEDEQVVMIVENAVEVGL